MSCCKFISIVFIFSLIFFGCNSASTRSGDISADTTLYKPPAPGVLPASELTNYQNGIAEYYEKKLGRTGFNGAILVAKNGQVVFEKYDGYYDLKKKDTLTANSAFHLASITKTFTGMAILKLEEAGKLSIDDDVKLYFPEFPYDNVTIRLLLNHRSGLPNYTYFMDKLGWNKKQYCSNRDVLDYLIKFKPPGSGRPDTHFSYCNTNYTLLALIIEKASGQEYGDYLKQTFFDPLRMKDTYVFNMATDSARAMPSFDGRGRMEPVTFLDVTAGDKNVYSTPRDLLKWDQALYTNQLFTKETLEKAFTPYSNERPGIRNYGLGWRMNVYPDNRKVIYHNGWWHGNNTVFIRMIHDSVTIIVLGNKYKPSIYKSKDIADVFGSGLKIEEE